MLSKLLLAVGGALLVGASHAALYKSIDADGNVVYSDVPPTREAEPLRLPPLNVIEPVRVTPRPAPASDDAQAAVGYSIRIAQPSSESTLPNAREIPVVVELQPELQPGHELAVSLDGAVRVRGTSTSVVVTDVERGAHRITAAVVDAAGNPLITSAPVVVYVRQPSVIR